MRYITISSDTLLWLHFTPNSDCYSDLIWKTNETNFVYEDATAIITLDLENGSLYWINNNAPNLIFPNNDTLFLTPTFQLRWEKMICAEGYELQFSKTEDFNNLELEISNILTNSQPIFGLIPNEKYYWRVGQIDALNEIHWSEIWNFKIDRTDAQVYRIYPNPTQGNLTFWFNNFSEKPVTITIFNTAGQLMQTYLVEQRGKAIELDLSSFQNGLYFLKFTSEETSFLEKIVIEK
ncbi:MAG: T9SS type A sorting domain-containing protein [Saprospiraceae bacterium]|nr:T9SS type A sorting domain-containing protein [Saprospiraceae bacterium]